VFQGLAWKPPVVGALAAAPEQASPQRRMTGSATCEGYSLSWYTFCRATAAAVSSATLSAPVFRSRR
jgi:hypothetical protein